MRATAHHARSEDAPQELETIGRCTRCGVECVGPAAQREKLLRLRSAHEQICPGGDRAGDVWEPLAAIALDS